MLATLAAIVIAAPGTPSYAQSPASDPANADARVNPDEAASIADGVATAETVAWVFDGSADAASVAALSQSLKALLSGEDARHLFGERGFRRWVAEHPVQVPPCLKGVEPCVAPETMVFDALDLSLVIRVALSRDDGGLRADYELVDRSGQVARTGQQAAADPAALASALASAIFDATGTLAVRSEPSGAEVLVGGQSVGTTPLSTRLPVGEHRYTVRKADYRPVEGTVRLRSGASEVVQAELELLAGALLVEGAPADAEVWVNERAVGRAGERVELEPGTYAVEVRAPGHQPFRDTVEIGPGATVRRRAVLEQRNPLLKDIAVDAIALNRYIGRLSYDHTFQDAHFRDARATIGDTELEFRSFVAPDAANPSLTTRDIDPNGLRFDFAYSWRNFGLVLLSASYVSSALDLAATVDSSATDQPVAVTVTEISRLQLRPLQVRYRHFYKNFVPFIEGGTGINLQWVEVDGELLEQPATLTNSEAFWTVGIGAQYFVTPNIFAMGRYGAQFYFDDGPAGTEHVFSLGAGVALPNLFGFEPEPPVQIEPEPPVPPTGDPLQDDDLPGAEASP